MHGYFFDLTDLPIRTCAYLLEYLAALQEFCEQWRVTEGELPRDGSQDESSQQLTDLLTRLASAPEDYPHVDSSPCALC